MTKRSLIDRILAGLDAKIADLQRARQNLIDMRAELEQRRRRRPATGHTDLSGTVADGAQAPRRRKPAAPPAADTEKVDA